MNEVIIGITGWHLAGASALVIASGFASKKAFDLLKAKGIEKARQRTEAVKDAQRYELDNLDHALYLMSIENIGFEDRDGSKIKLYRSIVSGEHKQAFWSALDFNRFLVGMRLSDEGLSGFDRAKAKRVVESFSGYALIAALYLFKDFGYLDAENYRQGKMDEARQFMADEFGIDFTQLKDRDNFFQLVRLIAKTSSNAVVETDPAPTLALALIKPVKTDEKQSDKQPEKGSDEATGKVAKKAGREPGKEPDPEPEKEPEQPKEDPKKESEESVHEEVAKEDPAPEESDIAPDEAEQEEDESDEEVMYSAFKDTYGQDASKAGIEEDDDDDRFPDDPSDEELDETTATQ